MFVGRKEVTHKIGEGVYTCPSCSQESSYDVIEVDDVFYLLYIPVYRFHTHGPFAVCRACDQRRSVHTIRSLLGDSAQTDYAEMLFQADRCIKPVGELIQFCLQQVTDSQWENYIAFEYGILEYLCEKEFKRCDEDNVDDRAQQDAEKQIIGFLRYYANTVYADDADEVVQRYRALWETAEQGNLRKLGYAYAHECQQSTIPSREMIKPYLDQVLEVELNLLVPAGVDKNV